MAAELRLPCLCLVADCSVALIDELPQRVGAAVDGGVSLVQLRAKELPGGQLLCLANELQKTIAGRVPLLINERVDVAAVIAADGVQLGEEALPVHSAKELLPSGSLIGRSVHTVAGAMRAASEGADFLVVGTMFASHSHPGEEPAGPELMRSVADQCERPLIGIGGITPGNLDAVIGAGASGIAVIRSILNADDPQQASQQMMSALQTSWRKHNPQPVS
jgi:thiamine-phosphate pyrophosphorylase